jgi:hypothetical protein
VVGINLKPQQVVAVTRRQPPDHFINDALDHSGSLKVIGSEQFINRLGVGAMLSRPIGDPGPPPPGL